MHDRIHDLYHGKNCDCGGHEYANLSAIDDVFKTLLITAKSAFKALHKFEHYTPEHLSTIPEYKKLIEQTANIFNQPIEDNVVDGLLRHKLKKDVFLFSGLRTHAQLYEASRMLTDTNGKIKSYDTFEKDFLKINKKYNQNYLEAEYEYAVQSSIMADKWNRLDLNDKYLLQYRTAADDRVRQSHQALHNITLPKNDAFWNEFYPPNGWRCRCTVVEVLPDKYPVSDTAEAIKKGEEATTQINKNGKNKLEIFRMNPGKDKIIFPKNHPYYPRHCQGEKLNLSGLIGLGAFVLSAEKDRCVALETVKRLNKLRRKLKNKEIAQWAKKFDQQGNLIKSENWQTGEFVILRKNVRSFSSHFADLELKELAKDIETICQKAQFLENAPLDKTSHNYEAKLRRGVDSYRYYKVFHNGFNLRINVEIINGKEYPYMINIIVKENA